jgi:HNH endonuclease
MLTVVSGSRTEMDAAIGREYREYLAMVAAGSKDDRLDLFEWIASADSTGYPWEPALEALSKCPPRTLWKTFELAELGEMREWSQEAGMRAAARRFLAAEDDVPYRHAPRVPRKIWEGIMARDKKTCRECGSKDNVQVDHIVPWTEGGSSTDPKNLQVLCQKCNGEKGAKIMRRRRRRQGMLATSTRNSSTW